MHSEILMKMELIGAGGLVMELGGTLSHRVIIVRSMAYLQWWG